MLRADGIGTSQRGLPRGGDVVVAVVVRSIEEENEEVGVLAVGEAAGGARPELLLNRGEPALRALPRVVRAIELVRTVGPVARGEEDVCGAGAAAS